jgi:hypothetical protein
VASPPVLDFGNNGAHQILNYIFKFRDITAGQTISVLATDEHHKKLERLKQLTSRCETCYIFDSSRYLSTGNNKSIIAMDDKILYYDDDHLSIDGVTLIASELEAQICDILNGVQL